MKKVELFFIFLLYGIIQIYAQDDHLEPECDMSGYNRYGSIVNKPFGKDFKIRFIAAPSWGHLTAFSMEKEKGNTLLKINTVSYAGRDERSPGFYIFKIDSLYEHALKSLFNEALSQVDFTEEDRNGLDGSLYYFVKPGYNGNLKIGKKWSPQASTLMYRLITLCDTISMATNISGLPCLAKLQNLAGELKEYNAKHKFKAIRYKSFGLFNLTDEQYKGRVDKKAYYPTTDGITDYAVWKIQYPDSLLQTDTWGWAVCQLEIDSLGYISAENYSASHPLFKEEAKRIANSMERWIPAIKDKRDVKSDVTFFIPFNPEFYRKRVMLQTPVLTPYKRKKVDKEPEFPDDIRSLVMGNRHWIYESLPDSVTATCLFTVNEQGFVENARIIEGKYPAWNNEVLSVVYGFPRAIPASHNGKYVPFDYTLKVRLWRKDFSFYRTCVENIKRELQGCFIETEFPSRYGDRGFQSIQDFIKSHLIITDEMKNVAEQGRVICSFIVNFDGILHDFRIVKGLHPLLDKEALRVLKLLPNKWSRGYRANMDKQYNEFYSSQYAIPVSFEW